MQVDRFQFLLLTSLLAAGCASNNARDLKQVTVVDLPPAPATPVATKPASAASLEGALPIDESVPPEPASEGEGIGLGQFGGIDTGVGGVTGAVGGIGSSLSGASGKKTKHPRIREGAASINGRLKPEVIQRIVRQHFGRFRMCYENGLRVNPKLQGRVAARFVIDQQGDVSSASDGGSDVPDRGVTGCVIRAFTGLKFPVPQSGIVTVVYPLIFSLADP